MALHRIEIPANKLSMMTIFQIGLTLCILAYLCLWTSTSVKNKFFPSYRNKPYRKYVNRHGIKTSMFHHKPYMEAFRKVNRGEKVLGRNSASRTLSNRKSTNNKLSGLKKKQKIDLKDNKFKGPFQDPTTAKPLNKGRWANEREEVVDRAVLDYKLMESTKPKIVNQSNVTQNAKNKVKSEQINKKEKSGTIINKNEKSIDESEVKPKNSQLNNKISKSQDSVKLNKKGIELENKFKFKMHGNESARVKVDTMKTAERVKQIQNAIRNSMLKTGNETGKFNKLTNLTKEKLRSKLKQFGNLRNSTHQMMKQNERKYKAKKYGELKKLKQYNATNQDLKSEYPEERNYTIESRKIGMRNLGGPKIKQHDREETNVKLVPHKDERSKLDNLTKANVKSNIPNEKINTGSLKKIGMKNVLGENMKQRDRKQTNIIRSLPNEYMKRPTLGSPTKAKLKLDNPNGRMDARKMRKIGMKNVGEKMKQRDRKLTNIMKPLPDEYMKRSMFDNSMKAKGKLDNPNERKDGSKLRKIGMKNVMGEEMKQPLPNEYMKRPTLDSSTKARLKLDNPNERMDASKLRKIGMKNVVGERMMQNNRKEDTMKDVVDIEKKKLKHNNPENAKLNQIQSGESISNSKYLRESKADQSNVPFSRARYGRTKEERMNSMSGSTNNMPVDGESQIKSNNLQMQKQLRNMKLNQVKNKNTIIPIMVDSLRKTNQDQTGESDPSNIAKDRKMEQLKEATKAKVDH